VLLGLITALIVARPLLPGEDPGRLLFDTGVANQVLTSLWLLAAVGWAGWRAWSQQGIWHGSIVEVGLLAVTATMFFSADAAGYKHPAYLIAWEWVGLFVAFCLVRQLVQTPRENQAVLAAVLATGISLSAFAIYQAVRGPLTPAAPEATLALIYNLDTEPLPLTGPPAATYADPATFAGFLVLIGPALGMAWYLLGRGRRWAWPAWAVKGCLLLFVGALALTQVWVAPLALLITALLFVIIRWRHGDATASRAALVEAALLAGAVAVLSLTLWRGYLVDLFQIRQPLVAAAWEMVHKHAASGVGPGNFGGELFSYRPSAGLDRAATPMNFIAEIAASAGLYALAALLLALGAFLWHVRSVFRGPWLVAEEPDLEADPHDREDFTRRGGVPWEFYLGGVVGLTMALVLSFPGNVAERDLMREGMAMGVRALLWFPAFALFCLVPWTPRALAGALTAGVVALLLYLLTAGGISFPSLAIPLWIMIALALNALPEATFESNLRHWATLVLPMPFLAVLCLAYLLVAAYPAMSTASHVAAARRSYAGWREEAEPKLQSRIREATSPEMRMDAAIRANKILQIVILEPLGKAIVEDPGNSRLWAELGYWHGKQWQVWDAIKEDDQAMKEYPQLTAHWSRQIVAARDGFRIDVGEAQRLDPAGKESYWVAYQLRLIFAQAVPKLVDRVAQYGMARNNLGDVLKRDPTNPRLQYLMAEANKQAGFDMDAWRAAQKAVELDDQTTNPRRKLSDRHRQTAKEWEEPLEKK